LKWSIEKRRCRCKFYINKNLLCPLRLLAFRLHEKCKEINVAIAYSFIWKTKALTLTLKPLLRLLGAIYLQMLFPLLPPPNDPRPPLIIKLDESSRLRRGQGGISTAPYLCFCFFFQVSLVHMVQFTYCLSDKHLPFCVAVSTGGVWCLFLKSMLYRRASFLY